MQHSIYERAFGGRLRRTARYFVTVVLGDGRSVTEASERLRLVHDRVTGIEPLTGRPYRARSRVNQLGCKSPGGTMRPELCASQPARAVTPVVLCLPRSAGPPFALVLWPLALREATPRVSNRR